MIVKRLLLLPGKGDVIICIFILLNVLMCGEAVSSVSCFGGSWNSALSRHSSLIYTVPSIYYTSSLVLVSNIINFSTGSAAEVVPVPQDPTQNPVLNKTDILLKRENNRENDSNFNKRRKASFLNSTSSVNESKSSYVSSVFVKYNNTVVSGGGGKGVNRSDTRRTAFLQSRRSSSASSLGKIGKKKSTVVKLKRKGRTRQNQSVPVTPRRKARKPRLLKELTLFNRQHCLAKLLCGVQVARPPTKSSSAVNDYAYLVKAFFDRFSIRGIVTDAIDAAFAYEQDALESLLDDEEDEEDDTSSENRKKKRTKTKSGSGGAAAHIPRRPAYEKYNPKYYDEYDKDVDDVDLEELVDDDVPEFMQPDILRRRAGRNMTHVKPFQSENGKKGINGSVIVDLKRRKRNRSRPIDVDRIRTKRGIMGDVKRGFMGFFNPRFDKTSYLNKRQLELESTDSKTKQFNIAEEIAARIRSPRQCRLLNWFGNTGTSQNPNAMTTTITTITGGMQGNGLNAMQDLHPATAALSGSTGAAAPGQVVTVIQQSPTGSQNGAVPTTAATLQASMLNSMGQTASSVMTQAGGVASHIGSTICPFNIQELQELILKAQNAPFPHFLTTTASSPTQVVPAQLFNPAILSPSSTAQTTTTTKATQAPPPSTSTMTVFVRNPTSSRYDPSAFANMYDYSPVPTAPGSHFHDFYPTDNEMYPSPIYPDQIYPTPFVSKPTPARVHQQQQPRLPAIVPSVGTAGEDDEGEFDDDPYTLYEKFRNDPKQKTPQGLRKAKPVPKWMTTTTHAPNDDDFYGYNEAMPTYVYGTKSKGGYKVTQVPPTTSTTTSTTAVALTTPFIQNYIRQYHQPPQVYDSKKKKPYPNNSHATRQPPQVKNNPEKKVTSVSKEENSDEDTSGTSDERSLGDEDDAEDDEGSDEEEASLSSSGSEEPRANINNIQQTNTKIDTKKPPFQSVEASEEDDSSNEAEEQKDRNVNDEEEEDSEEDHGGKRSYEQNDFSKDRGGPNQNQLNPQSPIAKPPPVSNAIANENSNSGFFSNFMNSLGSFTSFFNRESSSTMNIKGFSDKIKNNAPPQPLPIPPRPYANTELNWVAGQENSDEPEDEEDDDESEEAEVSEEPKEKKKQKVQKPLPQPTKIPWPKPRPKQTPPPAPSTTEIPVFIEESTSWANRLKGPGPSPHPKRSYSREDDSGDEDLRQNPVERYHHAVRHTHKLTKKMSPTMVSIQTNEGKHEVDINKYFSGLPLSPNSWMNEVDEDEYETSSTPSKKKSGNIQQTKAQQKAKETKDSEEEEDEEDSNESEENDSLPPIYGYPSKQSSSFNPPEPID